MFCVCVERAGGDAGCVQPQPSLEFDLPGQFPHIKVHAASCTASRPDKLTSHSSGSAWRGDANKSSRDAARMHTTRTGRLPSCAIALLRCARRRCGRLPLCRSTGWLPRRLLHAATPSSRCSRDRAKQRRMAMGCSTQTPVSTRGRAIGSWVFLGWVVVGCVC